MINYLVNIMGYLLRTFTLINKDSDQTVDIMFLTNY